MHREPQKTAKLVQGTKFEVERDVIDQAERRAILLQKSPIIVPYLFFVFWVIVNQFWIAAKNQDYIWDRRLHESYCQMQ